MPIPRARQFAFLTLFVATLTSCSAADLAGLPSTQNWLMIDNDQNLGTITTTYLVIDKGGAISQGGGTYKQYVSNSCSFNVPLSGNWNGTAVRITSGGGACGVTIQLTMTGTSSGEFGKAETMSGSYTITYKGAWTGGESGTWRASFNH